ncbi:MULTISPECIES: CaiB/BaiF CoA transferase family protein [Burkholderia]|uniref:CaiB/BaiF CoA transferase family protein n=1 Tax=Burkholderia TaxID=32008 RepID=UPI0008421511|nr:MULTISPECIES: CaiB/BaiF CoA-transferase family protein [unclassified Burkholderia]AOK32684.1 acyl-CoA transferase [Burkholderia sp. Bp7605]
MKQNKPEWSCLTGVTIVDLSQLLPGPHATALLAQLGANVVKVEPPGSGDASRLLGDAVFAQFNRGKRSVVLDIKTPEGKAALMKLVRDADALVEGFRPGVMAKLGLDYAALAQENPRIVMCSISGFGQTGPYANRPGHDLNYLAQAGYWSAPAQIEDKVARPRVRLADYAAASHAALALAVAVMSARQNGRGQHLDVSIHDTTMAWVAPAAWAARKRGADAPPPSSLVMPDNDLFETADGRHLALGILENKFWIVLRDTLGGEFPALTDVRFETRIGRLRHKNEVHAALKTVFATRTLAEWIGALASVDLPISPVLDADELFDDPHVRARGMVRKLDDGDAIALRFPVKFSLGLPDGDDRVPELNEMWLDVSARNGAA